MINIDINEEVGLVEKEFYFNETGRLADKPEDNKCITIITGVRDSDTGKALVKWWNTLDGTPKFTCTFSEYDIDSDINIPPSNSSSPDNPTPSEGYCTLTWHTDSQYGAPATFTTTVEKGGKITSFPEYTPINSKYGIYEFRNEETGYPIVPNLTTFNKDCNIKAQWGRGYFELEIYPMYNDKRYVRFSYHFATSINGEEYPDLFDSIYYSINFYKNDVMLAYSTKSSNDRYILMPEDTNKITFEKGSFIHTIDISDIGNSENKTFYFAFQNEIDAPNVPRYNYTIYKNDGTNEHIVVPIADTDYTDRYLRYYNRCVNGIINNYNCFSFSRSGYGIYGFGDTSSSIVNSYVYNETPDEDKTYYALWTRGYMKFIYDLPNKKLTTEGYFDKHFNVEINIDNTYYNVDSDSTTITTLNSNINNLSWVKSIKLGIGNSLEDIWRLYENVIPSPLPNNFTFYLTADGELSTIQP